MSRYSVLYKRNKDTLPNANTSQSSKLDLLLQKLTSWCIDYDQHLTFCCFKTGQSYLDLPKTHVHQSQAVKVSVNLEDAALTTTHDPHFTCFQNCIYCLAPSPKTLFSTPQTYQLFNCTVHAAHQPISTSQQNFNVMAKAAADNNDPSKMFSADVVAAVLAASGVTSLSMKQYEMMSAIDGSRTASSFQHTFRSIIAKSKELKKRVEDGEDFVPVAPGYKRGELQPGLR